MNADPPVERTITVQVTGFGHRPLDDEEKRQVKALREYGRDLIFWIRNLGTGPEFIRAEERVHEAIMWATKGIGHEENGL